MSFSEGIFTEVVPVFNFGIATTGFSATGCSFAGVTGAAGSG